jgi:hypothetical protein
VLFPLILNNSTLSQIVIISFFCITAIFYGDFSITISKLIFLMLILFSIVFNISQIEFKNAQRLLQITLGFMVFPLAINVSTLNVKYLRFGIIYVTVFAILDILNVPLFFAFREIVYPIEFDAWGAGFDRTIISITNRYGSIFYNPNLLGQSMLLIYILYLVIAYQRKFTKFDLFFLFCNVFCILVSGSRTAFVIFAIITFCYFMQFYRNKIKYLLIMGLIPVFLAVLAGTRLLDIGNTSGGSMDQKWQILFKYLGSLSYDDTIVALFGQLKQDIQFDNDLGNIIYYLGFLGLLYVAFFYLYEVLTASSKTVYFYSFLLVSYGATLLINFKFFIFTMIILSALRSLTKSLKAQRRARQLAGENSN